MKSAAWYEAHSFCPDTDVRHEPTPILDVTEELVGYMCTHCLERIIRVRRGLPLWILLEDA